MEQMEFDRLPSQLPDVTIFALKGPFTLATMFQFQSVLRDPELKGVIIDLSGVPYMDSAGLGVLLGQYSQAQRMAQKFALAAITPRCRTIFEITHTDSVLPIFATVEDAEKALRKAASA